MEHKPQCECEDVSGRKPGGIFLWRPQKQRLPKKKMSYCLQKMQGPQAQATDPGIFSSVNTNSKQNSLQNYLQEKVSSEYEERLRNNTYPAADNSILSSDSSSFCNTCSEDFTYRTYISSTTKTFQAGPCAFAVDLSVRRPTTPIQLYPAHKERTVVGKTCHAKGQSITSTLKYNKTNVLCSYPKLRSCKSDSDLLASFETSTTKCKDATTQTGSSSIYDKKAKAIEEMKNLKNVFLNFKCHLIEKTNVILESIFHKIMSDLTPAIPSLSSVTAEVFVEQCECEKEDLPSNVDVCLVASEIVENMLEKLESAVEKKCVEMFSQEDVPVNIKPSLTASDEHLPSSNKKPLMDSMPHTLDPMYDIAEDMVHTILEKPMSLTSSKQNEFLHPKDSTKLSCQQHKTDPVCMFLQRAGKNKSSLESDTASLIVNEEIQNLLSNIFSQSSLVGYIGEAISAILGYMRTELNNEIIIASEETVVLLQLLDDILVQLHQEPAKENFQKSRQPRINSHSDTKEKCRLAGTRLSNSPRSRRPFPPINVPGMVLYSNDEETDNIVKNVLDSAFKDEKIKSQEQIPNDSFTKGNPCFKYKRNIKPPTKPVSRSQVAFPDWELKTEPPSLNHKDTLKKKLCLNKVISTFSQDQKHQIQKASENIVPSVLKEMLKDISFVPPGHLDGKTGDEASVLVSQKPQGLSHQEWIDQLFSVSEIDTVAQEIRDSVLNMLHKAPNYISNTTNSYISSSVHQTSLDSSDAAHRVKEAPNKCSLKTWLVSEKKMQSLSSFNIDSKKLSWLKSGESELKPVDDINDKIIHIIFKSLKSFICPKLHMGFKSSLQSQLSRYTAKIVNIVLCAIQNELELHKKNLNLMEIDHTKSLTANTNKKLESLVTSIDDDILASPLLTCIYDMLSSKNADQRNISLSSCMPKSANDSVDEQSILPNRQNKKSFHKYMATPCALHSANDEKDIQNNAKLEVLDRIGETLHEMLSKLLGSQETTKKNQKMAAALQSNIQLISKAIFDYILAKLSDVDMDTSFASCGLKAIPESLDIDNPSFASIIEKMAKSTKIMSSIVSRMVQEGNKEGTQSKAKPVAPVSSKAESTKEMHPNKLRTVASDILNIVFAKLKEFANGYLEMLDAINDENKKSNKMGWECESTNISRDTHEESFLSALYTPAKKVSSAILKAIQTELNVTSSDLKTSVKTPPRETQILTDVVKLILDAVSSDMFNQTESEEGGIETYRYRPTYGSLPGGAESDSFLEDDAYTEKKITDDRSLQREEMKTHSLKQWALEKTLKKIEVKLKESNISPIAPIIRNILNEIFQSTLINQLNVLSLSHSHFNGMPHNVDEPIAQTSVQCMDKMIDPLISEADITIVTENIVNTVFHKLYSAAMTERNVRKNRYETINFSANVSFHEHSYEGKSSVLDKNPCTFQSRFSVADKEAKVNVVEDIVQAILTNLETFATSKVKSVFCSQVNFTVPMALPIQQDQSTLSKALSAKDPYSDEQFSYCSVDHTKSGETTLCQLSLSKLNTYAQVARKNLQEIKHELDKEKENHFLTDNIGISKSIAKQECFYLENVSSQVEHIFPREGILKKLFDKCQTESNDKENEKCKLLMIAENVLTEISIKAKELVYSLSLLNLPPLENCESRLYNHLQGASTRAEDSKAQINMFGREIVEMLFEKLQLCFLSQISTPDSKETLGNSKEYITAITVIDCLPIYNTKTKDQISMGSSNHIVQEIVERVLNMLESFVNLQFKPISKYEFSEIVTMPIENLFSTQQKMLNKKMLPKLQPLEVFPDESKSNTIIFKENIQDILLRVHSFHSELLTYAVNIISDMLAVIKNKLDNEISQIEPSSISILKENTVASEIIGTLIHQCIHFNESLKQNPSKKSLFHGAENAYIVNQLELATNMKTFTSQLKEGSLRINPSQVNITDFMFCLDEDTKEKYRVLSNLPTSVRPSVEDTFKNSEPTKRPDSEIPSCSRNKVQDHSPGKSNFGHFDEIMKENNSLPGGSISQKLFGKASSSTDSQYPPKNKPGIFPAKFLEDIITEMFKKLIFSSIPETQIQDRGQNVRDEKNQAKLYDTAMKFIDSLLKEFSDAQIKVSRQDTGNQFFPPVGKEPRTDEAPSSIKIKSADKMPPVDKMTKKPSSVKIPSTDKTLVNKVVHSSVCNILNEYGSQDSICKNINSNGENLARRLTSAVINEIFQDQLNLLFCDEASVSACLPLESKNLVKNVQKLAQTASKECQTSSPYTIILPHKFLENVISALLSKIFSTISSTETRKLEDNLFTELDFFQIKLVSAVATELSQNKHMIIQYVESLQSDDHEITELVVQSVYNNLLPQFGSREIINCVTSGCKILSETIVDLVLREVEGNQLQSYFCGGLTAHDIDRVDLKNYINEELNSDEDEVVLRESVAEEGFKVFKDQVKEVKKPEENKVSPKSTRSTSRLKKFLSLFNCCQTTASVNIKSTEATSNQVIESKETHVKRAVAELDMAIKKAMPETASSSWEKKPLCKKEEKNLLNEPPHYFIHRIMRSSSYDQEDLISSTSEAEDCHSDQSAEILEESSQEQKPENRSSVEFITIFENSKGVGNANSSNISETPTPNVSKRGSKMFTKMSSALSKVFSRNNTNISRSSSPAHHDEH
ncbi:fibrous sheath-interacting protein 2-like isoform X2 [Aotus nancymaae]|uniref:fibrous sheath-interacting protein 2-like isoform X2 n=1 Tax=Aotus nancymaae TaxID=37293 RepID=UPI0030FF1E98